LVDGVRAAYVQLVLPGLAASALAAAAAFVGPPPPLPVAVDPPPVALDLPPLRRPAPPVPSGWTPTIRVGEPAPAPAVIRRALPVLPEEVTSLDDRIRCANKNAVLSVGSCLGFQAEAEARLEMRTATTKRRAPSAYESARPVLTLHECIGGEVGRVATAAWRFRRAAHARLSFKRKSSRTASSDRLPAVAGDVNSRTRAESPR
jgi:hypothetical protein